MILRSLKCCGVVDRYLLPAFSWSTMYCTSPASSMEYFLNMLPAKFARLWSHSDKLVSSVFIRSFSGLASASMTQYARISSDMAVTYFKQSTTGPIKLSYFCMVDNTWNKVYNAHIQDYSVDITILGRSQSKKLFYQDWMLISVKIMLPLTMLFLWSCPVRS